jgi:hypothetical protein
MRSYLPNSFEVERAFSEHAYKVPKERYRGMNHGWLPWVDGDLQVAREKRSDRYNQANGCISSR